MQKKILLIAFIFILLAARAEDGYRLWMRYDRINNTALRNQYIALVKQAAVYGTSATATIARNELSLAIDGLLGTGKIVTSPNESSASLICAIPANSPIIRTIISKETLLQAGTEGFYIGSKNIAGKKKIVITANTDIGLLYGVYHFIRLLQTQQNISNLDIISTPKLKLRLLNHWDNLNRTVERGYAGFSLWDWHKLPVYEDPRYTDYARANASIGINGTVLTNVNANATILTTSYLEKAAALANIFRPYGIKVYLTARFSAPVEAGGLKTADPLDKDVIQWWKNKIDEIYQLIPDFGGFLVKANSEGQPGPQNYGRTHADGANMLADALAPHNGIVMWRAFVYSSETPADRHKQAYDEFVPLDGKFRDNVMVQVKNGAIDFQPREPFHPLFGAMPATPLMMEFQVTQEYLGQATQLVYLAPLFKETLESDTYQKGKGTTVAKIIDGTIDHHPLTGMAGVSNIGNDINWCGHPFAQANWFALGRLAWDHSLSSESIASEWLRMTFTNDNAFVNAILPMMMGSREYAVNYMTPLGLHHLMGTGHHYGPAPWVNNLSRADWTPVYYHKADSFGLGFDRTAAGSGALLQYAKPVQQMYENAATCPEKLLLWFHHVGWKQRLSNGHTLWENLCDKYDSGIDSVKRMRALWDAQQKYVDDQRFREVQMLLRIQQDEAQWWRDACLLYFQQYSKQPLPANRPAPAHSLSYYQQLKFPFAP